LAALWYQGSWSGLLLATGFAALVNLLLLATLVWEELLSPSLLNGGWLVVGAIWLSAPWVSGGSEAAEQAETSREPSEDLFRQAQREYLRGNWFEAESLLVAQLAQVPRDAEARLLWATLLRRRRRFEEARRELDRLAGLDAAAPWAAEIGQERHKLQAAEESAAPDGREAGNATR
jgi:hypothetical protein